MNDNEIFYEMADTIHMIEARLRNESLSPDEKAALEAERIARIDAYNEEFRLAETELGGSGY